MGKFRFSLAALFGLVTFVAVAIAALLHASYFVAAVVVTVTLFTLFLATALACSAQGARAVFWRTFALVGSLYFIATFCSPLSDSRFRASGLPGYLLRQLHESLARNPWRQVAAGFVVYKGHPQPCVEQVGHCLVALVFAFVFAAIAQQLYLRRQGAL